MLKMTSPGSAKSPPIQSQPFGWRDEVAVTSAIDTVHKDVFAAIAERSVLIGYEHLITAVQITS